jgi:hypothetical protein
MRWRLSFAIALALGVSPVAFGAQCNFLLLGAGTCGSAGGASPMLTSLVAYWDFEDTSGSLIDVHDNNDLTETGGTIASIAGLVSNARDFVAADTEYFNLADNTDLSTGDIDFTINYWVRLDSTSTSFHATKGFQSDNNAQQEWGCLNNGAVSFQCSFAFGTSTIIPNTSGFVVGGNIQVATWYMVTAWHDSVNNTVSMTVNASGSVVSSSHSGGVNDGNREFTIGARSSLGLPMDGLMDETGFWKRVLTSAERTWLYNAAAGRSYADLVACTGC